MTREEKKTPAERVFNSKSVKLTYHLLDPEWRRSLAKEFEKAYFKQILAFLENEKRAGKIIFPSEEDIFQAFNLTPLSKVHSYSSFSKLVLLLAFISTMILF